MKKTSFVPAFIITRNNNKDYEGNLPCSVLFSDISGFTNMTEKLMKHKKRGAEKLSVVLEGLYDGIINIISQNGGFVTGFAGDAVTALFTCDTICAVKAAFEIKVFVEHFSSEFTLSVKTGLSAGTMKYHILDSKRRMYYFEGIPLNDAVYAEHECKPGEILFRQTEGKIPGFVSGDKKSSCIVLSKDKIDISAECVSANYHVVFDESFVDPRVLESQHGEFRNVVTVFINFKPETGNMRDIVENTVMRAEEAGGYVSMIDTGDKGYTVMVLFGAPVQHENDLIRAFDFAANIRETAGNSMKAGINRGTVYAGIIGNRTMSTYTVFGDNVNTAARIMTDAEWGDIAVSESTARNLHSMYKMEYMGSKIYKGKSEPTHIFLLNAKENEQNITIYEYESVGRAKEKAIVAEGMRRAEKGKYGGIKYIYGEPGIGKSRLVYDSSSDFKGQILTLKSDDMIKKGLYPVTTLLSSMLCPPDAHDKQISFEQSWENIVSDIQKKGLSEETEQILDELERVKYIIAGYLEAGFRETIFDELTAKQKYDNFLMGVQTLFRGLSIIKPLMIIVEDLHWMDTETKELLAGFIRKAEQYPVYMLITSRYNDDGTKPVLDIESVSEDIELSSLEKHDAALFLRNMLGYPADDELFDFIYRKTDGNPFFIEQFCLYLLENDLLETDKEHYRMKSFNVDIPAGVNSIVVSRLDRLSYGLRKVIQTASVLGREFEIMILSDMLKGKVREELQKGENERIWSQLNEIRYIFKHAILRDTAYQMQLERRLKKLHGLAGHSMEKLFKNEKSKLSDIAYHYRRAGIKTKSIEYAQLAADYNENMHNNEEALELFRFLISADIGHKRKARIYARMSTVLQLLGKWNESESVFMSAIREAKAGRSLTEEAHAYLYRSFLYKKMARYEEAYSDIDRAEAIFTRKKDKKGKTEILLVKGIIYTGQGNYTEGLKYLPKFIEKAEDAGLEDRMGEGYLQMGNLEWGLGNIDKAMQYYKLATEESEKRNKEYDIGVIAGNMASLYSIKRDYETALVLYEKYIAIATKFGDRKGMIAGTGNIGNIHYFRGDKDKALECYKRKMILSEEMDDIRGYNMAVNNIAVIHMLNGEFMSAKEYLEPYLERVRERNDIENIIIALGNLGELYHLTGDMKKAKEMIEEKMQLSKKISDRKALCNSMFNMASIFLTEGRYRESMQTAVKALDIAEELNLITQKAENALLAAQAYCEDNQKDIAVEFAKKALDFGNEGNMKDVKIHSRLILAICGEDEDKENKLLGILDEADSDEQKAFITKALYELTGMDEYRMKSLSIFKQAYSAMPTYRYKMEIEKLEGK